MLSAFFFFPSPKYIFRVYYREGAYVTATPNPSHGSTGTSKAKVGRCKLVPTALKAHCFQTLNPESVYIAFNPNLIFSELAPLTQRCRRAPPR